MSKRLLDLSEILEKLEPILNDGIYVFALASEDYKDMDVEILAMFKEKEGVSVVLSREDAVKHNLPFYFEAAWITLGVSSDLNATGLTSSVSSALAEAAIPCNIIAAYHHDYLFVPYQQANRAIEVLTALVKP